jgi:hypothetical protein
MNLVQELAIIAIVLAIVVSGGAHLNVLGVLRGFI